MKLRSLRYVFPVAFLAIMAFVFSDNDEGTSYVPRDNNMIAQSAEGAFEYYNLINADPETGMIDPAHVLELKNAMKRLKPTSNRDAEDLEWTELGPDNIAGRVRAIESDPSNPELLYAGGISGGLYRSTDSGNSWDYVDGLNQSLVISAISILGNGNIYVGTGNSNEGISGTNGSGFVGNGLFKSTDGGETFDLVADFEPSTLSTGDNWSFVNRLIRNPNDPNSVWIAFGGGFREYIDGNADLEPTASGLPSGSAAATDADISADGSVISCVISDNVFISTDGGQNFEDRTGPGLPLPSGVGRAEFAMCPDDPNYMYAFMSTSSGYLHSVWASDDMGQNFDQIAFNSSSGNSEFSPCISQAGQCGYDQDITVVPGDCNKVILGGVRLYRWEKAVDEPIFGQWEQIAFQFGQVPGSYVHSDIHYFHWTSDNVLFIGTDGGIFRSEDNGNTIYAANLNLNVTQLYDMAYGPKGQVLGGSQDNGSMYIDFEGNSIKEARDVGGGDGFGVAHSQLNEKVFYTSIYNSFVARTNDGGNNSSGFSPYDNGPFFTVQEFWETDNDPNNPDSVTFTHFPPLTGLDSMVVTIDNPETTVIITNLTFIPNADSLSYVFGGETFIRPFELEDDHVRVLEDGSEFGRVYTEKVLFPGATIEYLSASLALPLTYDLTDHLLPQQEVKLPDNVSTWYGVGSTGSNPLSISRKAANFNTTNFEWMTPIASTSGTITQMKFSPDGNHLYVGTSAGRVDRISGLANAYRSQEVSYAFRPSNNDSIISTTTNDTIFGGLNSVDFSADSFVFFDGSPVDYKVNVTLIKSAGGNAVTGIAVDPNDHERVAISTGGYVTSSNHVMLSESAQSTDQSDSFDGVWSAPGGINGITRMPVYAITFDMDNPGRLIAGTEFGIFLSENDGGDWEECNFDGNGQQTIGRVPVYELLQQTSTSDQVWNTGTIYAGTHGRGFWYAGGEFVVDVEDLEDETDYKFFNGLTVYPNPLSSNGTISFDLIERNDVQFNIYDISGNLVSSEYFMNMSSGQRTIDFDASQYSSGIYIANIRVKDQVQFGKFVKL